MFTSRRTYPAILFSFMLAACGSDSSTERICQTVADCGEIRDDQVGACADELDRALNGSGDRAAEECADCLERRTCGDIADGACADDCEPVFYD